MPSLMRAVKSRLKALFTAVSFVIFASMAACSCAIAAVPPPSCREVYMNIVIALSLALLFGCTRYRERSFHGIALEGVHSETRQVMRRGE